MDEKLKELIELIKTARTRVGNGVEIKWLVELPLTDPEWRRFNDLLRSN